MSEQQPLQPPADPWAEAIAAEELTPPILYATEPAGSAESHDAHDAREADAGLEDASGTVVADTVRPTDTVRPAVADPPPARDRPRAPSRPARQRARLGGRAVIVTAIATVVILTGIGVGVGRALSRQDAGGGQTNGPSAGTNVGAHVGGTTPAGTPAAAAASGDPASASPSASAPSPVDSARPTSPEQAMALTAKQATAELDREADENKAPLAALAGHWVPQVDGKCVGMNNVDIQPNWQPNGTPDTQNVSVQQILAFHLALHQRFNALTARPVELAEPATARGGECAGRALWYSVVTSTAYNTDAQANAWCDANLIPVNECLARYVPRPGEAAKTTDRHPAPSASASH